MCLCYVLMAVNIAVFRKIHAHTLTDEIERKFRRFYSFLSSHFAEAVPTILFCCRRKQ